MKATRKGRYDYSLHSSIPSMMTTCVLCLSHRPDYNVCAPKSEKVYVAFNGRKDIWLAYFN